MARFSPPVISLIRLPEPLDKAQLLRYIAWEKERNNQMTNRLIAAQIALALTAAAAAQAQLPSEIEAQIKSAHIILLQVGKPFTVKGYPDWAAATIVFAIDKGYGYSTGPFRGALSYMLTPIIQWESIQGDNAAFAIHNPKYIDPNGPRIPTRKITREQFWKETAGHPDYTGW